MKRLVFVLIFAAFACTPKEPPLLTKAECEQKGGTVVTDPGDGSLKDCPAGKQNLGKVSGAIEGALCCK